MLIRHIFLLSVTAFLLHSVKHYCIGIFKATPYTLPLQSHHEASVQRAFVPLHQTCSYPITTMTRSKGKTTTQTTTRKRVTCTCGCGKKVSPPTKRKHLNGQAMVDVRAAAISTMPLLPHTLQAHSSNQRSREKILTQQRQEGRRQKSSATVTEAYIDVDGEDLTLATSQPHTPITDADIAQPPLLLIDVDTEPPAPPSAPGIAWTREARTSTMTQRRWGLRRRRQNISNDRSSDEESGDSTSDDDSLDQEPEDDEGVESREHREDTPAPNPDDSFFRQAFQREAAQEALSKFVSLDCFFILLTLSCSWKDFR